MSKCLRLESPKNANLIQQSKDLGLARCFSQSLGLFCGRAGLKRNAFSHTELVLHLSMAEPLRTSSALTMILVMRRIVPSHSFDHYFLCLVDYGLFLGCRIHCRCKNQLKISIHGENLKYRKGSCLPRFHVPLKMTVIIRSPLRWIFVFVTLFLLLGVHATGEKETGVNDTTDRLVSVLARPLLTLY